MTQFMFCTKCVALNWYQFYGTWGRFGHQKYDRWHGWNKPFIQEYMDFLKNRGISFLNKIGKVALEIKLYF